VNLRVGSGLQPTFADAVHASSRTDELSPANVRVLRIVLAAQVALGLLWGVSMLFFARQIALGDPSGPHVEKIALEGGAHFALVLGAILVWRAPAASRDLLLVMVFLNALWALTDAVYIPLFSLTAVDFYAKLLVNAALAICLGVAGRRAGLLVFRRA
jgi:hypothetical protein